MGVPEREIRTQACADCTNTVPVPNMAFHIIPPPHREEGGGGAFWLCESCWDRIVNAATMQVPMRAVVYPFRGGRCGAR